MPTYFQRPENALKRANEFIDVGKKQRALDALYDVIKSRKHRTWQKIHEPIMIKYLELCVELKKSHIAKEGLYQYKNISQQVNIKSLEDVVRGYLQLAEDKTEAAREESQQAVVDIDDLDNVQTPENLLLSAVSSEDSQDRTDRVVLTPWVKFLWESYRQCLELLRNNSRVERLYHDIAQQAFKFCLKYNRKTEFRKLCDNLRAHLDHINKHQNQQTSVNLNNPESQAMHLETRLVQLESAIQMELWQEAYKAIEGIHGLMALSKKAPKAQLMANYYQKLALVFWKAGNYLFHASALFRLFHLSREQRKNITQEEIQRMASRVVMATLAVPMPPNRAEIDRLVETDENMIDKNHRLLSTLLGLPSAPSRSGLVKDLVRFGVIQFAPSQVQDLYRWLEVEFHPLKLSSHVTSCFDFLQKFDEGTNLKQYIPALQNITVMRLIKEVSQVYQTIEFNRLLELAPFADAFYVENVVVEAARRNNLQVRVDHRNHCLHFGSELGVSQREESVEGPHLQGMPSEQIRHQLVQLHSILHKAVNLIQPEKTEKQVLRDQIISAYRMTALKEHRRLLERQEIIENRKQMLENISSQKEEEERKLMEDKQQKLREAEEERMAREAEERAKQRTLREQDELKKKVVMEKIEQLKKTELGARLFEGLEDEELQRLDPEEIFTRQMEQMDRERKEMQSKLRKLERKVDHLERAKRLEELPLLQKSYEAFKEEDEKFWEEEERERIKTVIAEREYSLTHRERIMRMKEDKDAFLEQLRQARLSVYKLKLSEFESKMDDEKLKRLAERKIERKRERREKWIKEKEEEEKRKIEENKRRIMEMKKKDEEERLAKLEISEAKQRAKLQEIEEREKKRAEELAAKEREEEKRLSITKVVEKDDWRKGGSGGGGGGKERSMGGEGGGKDDGKGSAMPWRPASSKWRERESEKKDSWLASKPSSTEREPEEGPPPSRRNLDDGPPSRRNLDDGPPTRRNLDDGPPSRRNLDDGPPTRRNLDDGPPSRRNLDDGPPPSRRNLDDGPPSRRNLDDGPPSRRNLDDGPPSRRGLDDGPRRSGPDDGPRRSGPDDGPPSRRGPSDEGSWRAGGRARDDNKEEERSRYPPTRRPPPQGVDLDRRRDNDNWRSNKLSAATNEEDNKEKSFGGGTGGGGRSNYGGRGSYDDRESRGGGGGGGYNRDREGGGGRGGDRGFGGDRDSGARSDRDRDSGRNFGSDRDRDGGERRGFGGDRDGGERRGFGGDRESGGRGFGSDRDRDSGRSFGGDKDRDSGRSGGFGGSDRDRDSGRGGFDRDGGGRGFDRDSGRDRDGGERSFGGGKAGFSDRSDKEGSGGSFRSKEGGGSDSYRGNRGEQSDRGGDRSFGSRGGASRGGGNKMDSKDTEREKPDRERTDRERDDDRPARKEVGSYRSAAATEKVEKPVRPREEPDEDGWTKVRR